MEWFQRRQYKCAACDDTIFKSRSDWLIHLVVGPHSSKVLHHFQQWQEAKKGELYVISGLAGVENSMLLEYISDNLHTFSDIVFFKPKANICIIVGDGRELEEFTALQHRVVGVPLHFKAYNTINNAEWKSYFQDSREEIPPQGPVNSPPVAPSAPPVNSAPLKRKLDETIQLSGNNTKSAKLSHHSSPNTAKVTAVPPSHPSGGKGYQSASFFIDKHRANFEEEMDKIQNYIFMPRDQIDARKNIITHLTDVFKKAHPKCKIIPVGADILGFNLDQTIFTIYFDSKGFTDAENATPTCKIIEATPDVDRIRTSLFVKLKTLQTEGILNNVQCHGANCIKFSHVLFGINCNLLLKPFMMAQTAKLCKQIYYTNETVSSLLNMVVYWAMQHQHFCEVGFTNPYVVYWLVYFFLMKKNILPPVIELQRTCAYEIVDGQDNVAFSYDESVFSDVISTQRCSSTNARGQIELLFEWFQFIDETLCEGQGAGVNRRHSLVCPRFGELIDKRKFTVCWEKFRDKKKKFTGDQKRVRKLWKENLTEIGFPEEMWESLLGLKLPDTLSVQHPLYISENISLAFEGPFAHRFFKAVEDTRDKLSRLLSGDGSVTSLLLSLSDFSI